MSQSEDYPQAGSTQLLGSGFSRSRTGIVFILVAGVLIPAAAILFEMATKTCSFFFDPMPRCGTRFFWPLCRLATSQCFSRAG